MLKIFEPLHHRRGEGCGVFLKFYIRGNVQITYDISKIKSKIYKYGELYAGATL